MLIRITSGLYGYHVGEALVPKTRFDPPFEVDDEEAKRLVEVEKVAEYAGIDVATPVPDDFGVETVENAPAASEAENGAENDESGTAPEKFWDDTLAGEIKQSLGEAPSEGEEATDTAEMNEDVVEYSVEMKAQELRDIAAQFGITFPAVCSKAAMVAALDEFFATVEDGQVDLTPADPE